MALYVYVKAPPQKKFALPKVSLPKISVAKKKVARISSFVFTAIGVVLVAIVAVPLLYYQFVFDPGLTKQKILSPVPVVKAQDQGQVLGQDVDYTNANTWFPTAQPQIRRNNAVSSYSLSIPDLRIKDATVIIGAEDLSKSLIHYGGTGLPGEYGNTVIFGHSILPIFYDPKSYKAIFSTIPTLERGAKIYINYDGIEYVYQVFEQEIVGPDDVSVLSQRYDDSYLSLITCYPPGTYWKRIVVRARLVRPDNK